MKLIYNMFKPIKLADVKRLIVTIMVVGLVASHSANAQHKDSLSLEYTSLAKLFKTYKSNYSIIGKDSFRSLINSNQKSSKLYQQGRKTKVLAGITGGVSLGAYIYFTKVWIEDDIFENPPIGYFASAFGLIGAKMLHLKGKNRMQIAINEYNGSHVTVQNPFRVNLSTGFPTYGIADFVDTETEISQQRSIGLGVEAHLYKEYFGYVDLYTQKSVTDFDVPIDKIRWENDGYTVMTGIGMNHGLSPKLSLIAKWGVGLNSINRRTFYNDKFLKEDRGEQLLASQIGLGLRYFPLEHIAVGLNANFSNSTPLVGFEFTSAF